MIDHLFRVPEQFWNPALYERFGALVKDRATGKIIGHLQETGAWKLSTSLPVPGGNPLQLVTEAVQVAQLAGIQQTLNVVQTLATVGAVASVASLGVSLVGFTVVVAKLARLDRKLDRLLGETRHLREAVSRLDLKMDALPLARLRAELEGVALAVTYEPARRKDALQRAINELSVLRHYYHALLADESLYRIGTAGIPAVLDAHERLVACCQGELMAELSLADDPAVLRRRWANQKDQLLTLGWRDGKELYDILAEGDRAAGVYNVTPPTERSAMVKAFLEVRTESLARLEAAPHLSNLLQATGTTPGEYVASVSKWSDERPLALVLASDFPSK